MSIKICDSFGRKNVAFCGQEHLTWGYCSSKRMPLRSQKSVEFALRYDLRLTVFPFPAAYRRIRNAQFFCKRFLRQQQFHPHILHFLGKLHRTPHSSTLPSSNLDLSSAKILIWRIAVLFNSTSRSDWLTPRSIKYAFKFSRLERQISCDTSA